MAAMLSLTLPTPTAALPLLRHHLRRRLLPTVSASRFPPPPPASPYQPFRPPPSPLPAKYRSLSPTDRLDILRNRLGLWHEYAPLISSLAGDGFTPPSIEEITGITGVDQNCLTVAARVRDSLLSLSLDPAILAFFDSAGGADLLYELRFLNAVQRTAAAKRIAELGFDPKAAQELARAMKDFPRRRGEDGWEHFSGSSPDDCLAFTYYRLSLEALSDSDRMAALEKALETAGTDGAREFLESRLAGKVSAEEEAAAVMVTVPVVRLNYGEIAEATTVALLPVCRAGEGAVGLGAVPKWCKVESGLGVVAAEKGWGRWVVLPGWGPVVEAAKAGGVAVEFTDARALPWKVNRWAREEAVLVVGDRARREVVEDGFYLVSGEKGELALESGKKVLGRGESEALATVIMVVRPPKEEEDDQLGDEDWV